MRSDYTARLVAERLLLDDLLRADCLTLETNEFRCYEAKIEGSEKADSCWESNPGHLWSEPPVLCH